MLFLTCKITLYLQQLTSATCIFTTKLFKCQNKKKHKCSMENQVHGNSLQQCKQQHIQTTATVAAAEGEDYSSCLCISKKAILCIFTKSSQEIRPCNSAASPFTFFFLLSLQNHHPIQPLWLNRLDKIFFNLHSPKSYHNHSSQLKHNGFF